MGLLTLDGVWQFAKVPHASRAANTQSFENEVIKEAPAKVPGCELQIIQLKLSEPVSGEGLGAIVTECTVEVTVVGEKCLIKVAPQSNEELKKVLYKNEGENLLIKQQVEGITDTTSGLGCKTGGITATTTGKFTGEETAPGVNTQ